VKLTAASPARHPQRPRRPSARAGGQSGSSCGVLRPKDHAGVVRGGTRTELCPAGQGLRPIPGTYSEPGKGARGRRPRNVGNAGTSWIRSDGWEPYDRLPTA